MTSTTHNPGHLTRDEANARRAADIGPFVQAATAVYAEWTLRVATAEQLTAALHALGDGNRFEAVKAAEVLSPLVGDMMGVLVGNSGPRITFTLPWFAQQRLASEHSTAHEYTICERQAMAERVIAAGRTLRADSIRVGQYIRGVGRAGDVYGRPGDNPDEVSLWWD